MKKITSLLCFSIALLSSFSVFSQFSFPVDAGPYTVGGGTPVTVNVNDVGNSGGVTAGLYDSFTITVNWADENFAWSSEADLTVITSAGSVLIDPPTSGGGFSNATTLTFSSYFTDVYDPSVDGSLDIVMNQSYSGSSAIWTNILVTLNEQPACPSPLNLLADNITSSSADLSWTQSGSSTSWNIEVVSAGTTPTGTPTETGVTNPHTVTGLVPVTGYNFYVQADCGTDGLSEWSGPFSFTTSCDVYVPDYLEDFTVIPADCWEEADAGNPTTGPLNLGGGSWTADGYLNNGTTGAFKINLYSSSKSDWILSPQIDLTGGPFQVEFDFGVMKWGSSVNAGTLGSDDQVQFLMSTDNGVTWTALISWDNTSVFTASGAHYVFDLSAYNGVAQFGVWASEGTVSDPVDVDVFFDNFRVRAIPTCPEPSQLEASNIGPNSAQLSWTQTGSSTSWNIEVVPTGTTPTGTPTETGVSNPHTVTGLTSVTGYDFYVQADCGTDGLSEWVGPLSFTTSCDVYVPDYLEDFTVIPADCWNEADDGNPTTGPLNIGSGSWTADGYLNNGNTGAFKINLYSTGKSDWILSPQIDLTGGPFQVEFDFGVMVFGSSVNAGSLGSDDQVQFLMSTDNGVTWTALISWDNTSVFSASGSHYVFDLTAFSGDTVQFGVWASEGAVNDPSDVDVFFDNFRVRSIPTCPDPSQLEVLGVGTTTAELTWLQSGAASTWNIEYGPAGFALGTGTTITGVTSNPYELTNLTPDTHYDFYVQADCGTTNGLSEWVGKGTFFTGYCESVPTSNDGNGVSNVQIVATDFPSFGDVTYEDHTGTVVNAFAGILTNVQITFVTGYTYDTHIWIDFNDNLIFEPSELVYSGESTSSNPSTLNASFTMPANAPVGQHRMRIGSADFGQSIPNPCYNGGWGVTLDFILNIDQLTCTLPEATFTMTEDCDNSQVFVEVDVTNVGDASTLLISNNANPALNQQISAVGTYQVGPFALDQNITISLINEQNTDCTILSPTFTSSCPTFCLTALPICAGLTYPSIVGNEQAPEGIDYGCLMTQPNPQWNTILFDLPGDYQFLLEQTNTNGTPADIDFIIWGPFSSQEAGCFQLLPENQVDCSYSATASETININGVQAGDIYILLMTNYSQDPGTYTFEQQIGPADGTNCEVVCDVVIEEVGGIDVIGIDTIDFCGETSVTIQADSPYADEYDWYMDGFYLTTTSTPSIQATESGQYFVIARGDVCDGDSQSEFITINLYMDTAFAVQPNDMVTCSDGFAEFDLDSQTPVILAGQLETDYSVSYYATLAEAEAGDLTTALSSPYTNISNPQIIYVRVEDINAVGTGSACYSVLEFMISTNLNDDPSFTITPNCSGATVVIDGDTGGVFAFNPMPGDGASIDPTTGEVTNAVPGGNYTVEYTTVGTCPMVMTQTITIPDAEDATFTLESTCDGAMIKIVSEVHGDTGGVFAFNPVPGDGAVIDPITGVVTKVTSGTSYTIEYTTAGACPVTSTETIIAKPCVIPQVITPNGDGFNDSFDLSGYDVNSLEIFNRNGVKVYSRNNYTNEFIGLSDNGKELPTGTYFYVMKYKGSEVKSAWLYINREK